MRKESVRALKEELRSEVLTPFIAEALEKGILGIRTRRASHSPTPRTLGLGITAHSNEADGFKLAIRIQHPALRKSAFINRLKKRACGEVDVRFVGHIHPLAPWYQDTCRPLLIGSSIAHYSLTAGTLGAFVRDRTTGQVCVLSNNHVLAAENTAQLGDPILQPGLADGGQIPGGLAASFTRCVTLQFPGPNLVDAAIATVDAGITEDVATLSNLGILTGLRATELVVGETVSKLGRSSGLTTGTIKAFELINVSFEYDSGTASFENLIEIESSGRTPFSIGGDSGSLIVDSNRQALGLLCAGSNNGTADGSLSYANPLSKVLELLNVDLLH